MNMKKIRDMTLKERFDRRGFGVTAYARAYGVDASILSKVLQGQFDGSKGHRGGKTRIIILQLKNDKVWIGKLPWEK
ncbi:MAG: hypothetical protein C0625_01965 [Arcobacter sp.]|nr:MAG: hypothetical protein C0625_01965 [Arcobacter sp.]